MTIKAEMINPDRLTPREAQVAAHVAAGLSNKQIARCLAMAVRMVDTHVGHIIEKLGLHAESLSTNADGLNLRVRVVAIMVARGMVRLSINLVFAFVVLNSVMLDDNAARVKRVRHGSSLVRLRRCADA